MNCLANHACLHARFASSHCRYESSAAIRRPLVLGTRPRPPTYIASTENAGAILPTNSLVAAAMLSAAGWLVPIDWVRSAGVLPCVGASPLNRCCGWSDTQSLRVQRIVAIPRVPEHHIVASIPLQASITGGLHRLMLDESIRPVCKGGLTAISQEPCEPCHCGLIIEVHLQECVKRSIHIVPDEIVVPVVPLHLIVGLLVENDRVDVEVEIEVRECDRSIEQPLHDVPLRLNHGEGNSGMHRYGVVEHILDIGRFGFALIFEICKDGQTASSEVFDGGALCAVWKHAHVAVNDRRRLAVLEGGEQLMSPSHGSQSTCRRSSEDEIRQGLVKVPFRPIGRETGVLVAILRLSEQRGVCDKSAPVAIRGADQGVIPEQVPITASLMDPCSQADARQTIRQ